MNKLLGITVLILGTFSLFTHAAPKKLICTSSASYEAARLTKIAKEFADPNYIVHNIESSKEFFQKAEVCKTSQFGWKEIIIIDTDGLLDSTKNEAENQRTSCNGFNTDFVKVTFSATPRVITFTSSKGRPFNVDRKDLKAGYDTERDYSCQLQDIDLSKNLL